MIDTRQPGQLQLKNKITILLKITIFSQNIKKYFRLFIDFMEELDLIYR